MRKHNSFISIYNKKNVCNRNKLPWMCYSMDPPFHHFQIWFAVYHGILYTWQLHSLHPKKHTATFTNQHQQKRAHKNNPINDMLKVLWTITSTAVRRNVKSCNKRTKLTSDKSACNIIASPAITQIAPWFIFAPVRANDLGWLLYQHSRSQVSTPLHGAKL